MILFVGFLLMEIVMPQISRTALVPYSAEQMYQLVNDVQSYSSVFAGLYRKSDSGVHSWADDCGGRCL
ncbi:putative oligoketide cyclase/lipid transport protein [Escherichia coli]|uniref:Putative oligoketide cyclase/lipid transport protein n=1 Tax=Escherichia coli TaxID=562 RepID=A0A377ALH2_ECOLX|nr:putative oligoketide cyclase/lipid transport protein [Escherichia coli]